MNERKVDALNIGLIFFFALSVMLPQLISRGYYSVLLDDAVTFTGWAWQFVEGMKEGVAYPRWTPINFWEYGSPTFLFYPPLAYYLTALFNVFTDSVIAAMNVTKFVSLFLYGVGMYILVREFFPKWIACSVSIFLIIFPYVIYQYYFTGTFASVVSFMWFPYLFLFAYRYLKSGELKYVIYAGVCYGGLILTHLINAYMFTFVIAAFAAYMAVAGRKPQRVFFLVPVIATGILVSAAYLLPLIYERRFINTKAFFDFFPFTIPGFVSPARLLGKFPHDINELYIMFSCLLLIIFLLRLPRFFRNGRHKEAEAPVAFFCAIAAGSIFLLFRASAFLWEIIPYFKYIQFSWRWFNITCFAIAFLFAPFLSWHGTRREGKGGIVLLVVLFSTCIVLDYQSIKLAHVFAEGTLIPPHESHWTPEHVPAWVDTSKIDKDMKERATITNGEGKVEIREWVSAERIITIEARTPLTLKVRTFNFPGWKAFLDGVQTVTRTEGGGGAMLIDLPEGVHSLSLRFDDTPVRHYSMLISVFSIILVISYIVLTSKGRN